MAGEVIGINTAILSPSGGSIGIGFATPSDIVEPVIDQLEKYHETRRGWLGVRIQSVDDAIADSLGLGTARGALVAGVDDKGPAKPAGLMPGDVIITFDGKDVKEFATCRASSPRCRSASRSMSSLSARASRSPRRVTLGRLEDGDKTAVASADAPADSAPAKPEALSALGLELAPIDAAARKSFKLKDSLKGVVVVFRRARLGGRRQGPARRRGDRGGQSAGGRVARRRRQGDRRR